jgi:hypothetical protein
VPQGQYSAVWDLHQQNEPPLYCCYHFLQELQLHKSEIVVTTISYSTFVRLQNYDPYMPIFHSILSQLSYHTLHLLIFTLPMSVAYRELLCIADSLQDNSPARTPQKTVAPLLSCVSDILATVIALFRWQLQANKPQAFLPVLCALARLKSVYRSLPRNALVQLGSAWRKHRFPYCCVHVFSRKVFTGPLLSNTRYNIVTCRLLTG